MGSVIADALLLLLTCCLVFREALQDDLSKDSMAEGYDFVFKHPFEEASEVLNGHTYLLNKATRVKVDVMEAACHWMGGYLAEITDQEEFDFVYNYLKPSVRWPNHNTLVGGRDDLREGHWYFPHSQRPMEYFNWRSGQPDDARYGQDCLDLNRLAEKFADVNCDPLGIDWRIPRTNFLCEIETYG